MVSHGSLHMYGYSRSYVVVGQIFTCNHNTGDMAKKTVKNSQRTVKERPKKK